MKHQKNRIFLKYLFSFLGIKTAFYKKATQCPKKPDDVLISANIPIKTKKIRFNWIDSVFLA